MKRFGDRLATSSQGRYEVRVYDSSRVGSEKEMQEMLTIGTLEITVTGLLSNYEPLFTILEMPYLYRDREHVTKVMRSATVQKLSAPLIPKGIRLVGFVENGFRHITNSKRPINEPRDLEGLMIRTPENPAQIETFRALGAIPTPLSFSELYTALLQGVVDGQENPLQNIWFGRLFEAQPHLALTGHIYNSAYVLISEHFWSSISQEDRSLILEAVDKASNWQMQHMVNLDGELEVKLRQAGVEITEPDRVAFAEATEPAYQALYERLGDRARQLVEEIRKIQ
jgi:tripartite ATP-independent transporter DctP family solute receptor